LREARSWPLLASHTFAVLSLLAVTKRVPSGLKAAECTVLAWPLREVRG
jgi:hypothetical protein